MALSLAQAAVQLAPGALLIGASATATLGSTPTPGNLLVAALAYSALTTNTVATGWTGLLAGGSSNGIIQAAYRVVQPGDTTTVTPWSSMGSAGTAQMTVWEVTGFVAAFNATSYLQEVHSAQSSLGGTATASFTSGDAGSLLLFSSVANGSTTLTPPTGVTADFANSASSPDNWAGHETGIAASTAVSVSISRGGVKTCAVAVVLLSPGAANTLSLSAGASFTGAFIKKRLASFTAGLSESAAPLSRLITYKISAGASFTGKLIRSTSRKLVVASQSFVGNISKGQFKQFTAGASFAGSLIFTHIKHAFFTAGQVFSGALSFASIFVRPHYSFTIIRDDQFSITIERDNAIAFVIIRDNTNTGNVIME